MPFGASTAVSPSTALTFSAVLAAMRLLSESVSTLPLNVYKKENNGDRVEQTTDLSYLLKYTVFNDSYEHTIQNCRKLRSVL